MSGKRIWLLNAVCVAALIAGVVTLQRQWNAFAQAHQVALLKDQAGRAALPSPAAPPQIAEEAWTDILARNPFSFDRNDINIVEAPPPPTPSGPKPIAMGTILMGGERLAMLSKPGVRGSVPYKVGESVDGWKVVEIKEKSVVIASNGTQESLEVGRVPIDRDHSKTSSAAPPNPAPSTSAAAAVSPSPAAARATPPAPAAGAALTPPPGTHLVVTPFGTKFEQDQ